MSHYKFEEGALSYLTGGSHIGETATVRSHEIKRSSKDNEVSFDDFGTIADYVFIIGDKKRYTFGGE
jgi:small subunit ribosomal protein S4e